MKKLTGINMRAATITKLILGLFVVFNLGTVQARDLIGLDYSVMTGNAVQLVFTFSEPAVEPRSFTIEEPARIALDFAGFDAEPTELDLVVESPEVLDVAV